MNKQIFVYILLICFVWGGIYFFQERKIQQEFVESIIVSKKNIQQNTIINSNSEELLQQKHLVIDNQQDNIFVEEKPEPRFEEILYPEEYDFDDLHAGSVYEKAGKKIKVDFSYMLDKKLGDEATIHFPNASVTGKIVNYEVDNGPEGIKAYTYRIDVNNSIREDGSFPEQIMLHMFEQNGYINRLSGNFETPNANGQFYLEKGIGYFTTKEEYGNAVMELGIKTD